MTVYWRQPSIPIRFEYILGNIQAAIGDWTVVCVKQPINTIIFVEWIYIIYNTQKYGLFLANLYSRGCLEQRKLVSSVANLDLIDHGVGYFFFRCSIFVLDPHMQHITEGDVIIVDLASYEWFELTTIAKSQVRPPFPSTLTGKCNNLCSSDPTLWPRSELVRSWTYSSSKRTS